MNDNELFLEVLDRFIDTYNIKFERPYGDDFIVISSASGKELGQMNYSGYNLLYNLTTLCNILKSELN